MIGAVGGTFGVVGGTLIGQEVLEALFTYEVNDLTISVDGSPSTGANTYEWDFGDGSGVTVAAHSWTGEPNASTSTRTEGGVVRTNLILNPSGEVTPSPWYGNRGAVLAYTDAESVSGVASILVSSDGSETAEGISSSLSGVASVGKGATGTLSVWVKAALGTPLRLYANEYEGSTYRGQSFISFTGTGEWQRVSVTRTLTTGETIQPALLTTSAVSTTFYVDAWLLEASGTVGDYFDGDTLDELAPFTGIAREHAYAESGDYTVSLTVTGAQGETDTLVQTVVATDPGPMLTTVAQDSFDRTVAETSTNAGFGTAPIGGAWASSANVVSVASGEGRHRLTAPNTSATSRLRGATSTNFDTTWRLALDKIPDQSGVVMLIRNRIGETVDNDYRLKVRAMAPGRVLAWIVRAEGGAEQPPFMGETDTGLTYTTADVLNVRFLTTGSNPTRLRTRFWLDGQPEPSTWLHDITDSTANLQGTGHIAISNLLSGEVTNAPIVVRVLELLSTAPTN